MSRRVEPSRVESIEPKESVFACAICVTVGKETHVQVAFRVEVQTSGLGQTFWARLGLRCRWA